MVAGVGLTLFQQIIPRPGLASGLFANAARLGYQRRLRRLCLRGQ